MVFNYFEYFIEYNDYCKYTYVPTSTTAPIIFLKLVIKLFVFNSYYVAKDCSHNLYIKN